MRTRPAQDGDREDVVGMIAEFRVELARFRLRDREPDRQAAAAELAEHESRGHRVFVAEDDGATPVGYLVCRVDGDVVWAESLYVLPAFRRRGVASALYAEAERLAENLGSDTTYNWVHPNNDAVIGFLRSRGYTVLNLVELRRARPGERISAKVRVGSHEFDY